MTWRETEDASGLRVDFSGPGPSSRVVVVFAWLFLASSLFMFAFLLLVARMGLITFVMFAPFIAAGVFVVVKMRPHPSRGRLGFARGRITVDGLREAIDVASINEIDAVRGEQNYYLNDEPRSIVWFDVVARTERGERVLARFSDSDCATFFCERVRLLAKLPQR